LHQSFSLVAQKSKFSLEANYGLNGNFFVRSYDELGGPNPKTYFYKKDFIGSIAGLELKFKMDSSSTLSIAYAQSINSKRVNFDGPFNSIYLQINNYSIRHINYFYQFSYEGTFNKRKNNWKYQAGLFYLRSRQQEILLENFNNLITLDERDYKHDGLEEGGIFAGLGYFKPIDRHFSLGIRSRVYFLISTGTFEAVTLTPALSYNF
jgi:hypothetical protein